MDKVYTIKIDDKEYLITDEIEDNGKKYVYLSYVKDFNDFCIRKISIEDGEEFLIGLDSVEEFGYALKLFENKHKDSLN